MSDAVKVETWLSTAEACALLELMERAFMDREAFTRDERMALLACGCAVRGAAQLGD